MHETGTSSVTLFTVSLSVVFRKLERQMKTDEIAHIFERLLARRSHVSYLYHHQVLKNHFYRVELKINVERKGMVKWTGNLLV